MFDVLDAIYVRGRLAPEHPAIVMHDRLITYGMLVSGILSVERKLSTLSLDRDKPVAVCIDSVARHIIVCLALGKAGFASLSLTPATIGQAAGIAGAVLADQRLPSAAVIPMLVTDDWFMADIPASKWALSPVPENRVVRLAQTSGSSGAPKTICFSEGEFGRRLAETRGRAMLHEERVLMMFGLSAHVGLVYALTVLGQGNTIVSGISIENSCQLIRSAAVTYVAGSPQHLSGLTQFARERTRGGQFPTVRRVLTGGGFLSRELLEDIRSAFNAELTYIYASTEAGAVGFADMSLICGRDTQTNRFVMSHGVQIENPDPETGAGAIRIKTPHMGQPYVGSLIRERAQEWFYPGDTGYIDEDGFLVVVGRTDDLVNMGGIKRSAEFFEGYFQTCPLIRDCAVVRVTGPTGPATVLLVSPAGDFDRPAIEQWGLKHPLRLAFDHVAATPSIPRNTMGKVEREGARRIATQLLG